MKLIYTLIDLDTLKPILTYPDRGDFALTTNEDKGTSVLMVEDRFAIERIRIDQESGYDFEDFYMRDLRLQVSLWDKEKGEASYQLENHYDRYDFNGYDNEPIGGGNPYYCCSSCGISDPQINGGLSGHSESCEYREQVEKELENKELKMIISSL